MIISLVKKILENLLAKVTRPIIRIQPGNFPTDSRLQRALLVALTCDYGIRIVDVRKLALGSTTA